MLRTTTAIVLLLAASPATAAGPAGKTFSTYAARVTQAGRLTGCELVFGGATYDTLYQQGKPIVISGSVNLNGYDSRDKVHPSIAVKLVVEDVVQSDPIKLKPSAPSFVVLEGSDGVTTRDSFLMDIPSETPGAWFGAYRLGALSAVMDRLSRNELALAFNRRPGGVDLHVVIDLNVGRDGKLSENTTSTEFLACAGDLMAALKPQLGQ